METKSRREGTKHIELIPKILWQLWKYRNNRTFNRYAKDNIVVIETIVQEWQEFEHANSGKTGVSRTETDQVEQLVSVETDEENAIKINLDVQISKTSRKI